VSRSPLSALALSDDWSWLVLALLGACAVAAWVAVARLAEIERRLKSLEPTATIRRRRLPAERVRAKRSTCGASSRC
jgi:hypothetical protein